MPRELAVEGRITLPTALAAPCEEGMMFCPAPPPPPVLRRSAPSHRFLGGGSRMHGCHQRRPDPKFQCSTLRSAQAIGACREALETISSPQGCCAFTPITNIGVRLFMGGEHQLFWSLASNVRRAVASVRNRSGGLLERSQPPNIPPSFQLRGSPLGCSTRSAAPLTISWPSLIDKLPFEAAWGSHSEACMPRIRYRSDH